MSYVLTKTPHQKIDHNGISSQWEGEHRYLIEEHEIEPENKYDFPSGFSYEPKPEKEPEKDWGHILSPDGTKSLFNIETVDHVKYRKFKEKNNIRKLFDKILDKIEDLENQGIKVKGVITNNVDTKYKHKSKNLVENEQNIIHFKPYPYAKESSGKHFVIWSDKNNEYIYNLLNRSIIQ